MSRHPRVFFAMALLSASLFTGQAFADRTLTDQLGREVTLPDRVTRAVVLQHQTLNLLVQLNAADDVVGVLSSWKKQLGPQFARFMPNIEKLPMPGDLTQVNIESLLALHPQVVFVANYAPQAMIQQIQSAGIPVVAISLRQDAAGEKNKMNPTMANEEQAYNEGLKQGIRLIGEVVGRQDQAEQLIDYTFSARSLANAPVADIPENERVRVLYGQSGSQHLRFGQIYRPDDEARRSAERSRRQREGGAPGLAGAGTTVGSAGNFRSGPLPGVGQTDTKRPAVAEH